MTIKKHSHFLIVFLKFKQKLSVKLCVCGDIFDWKEEIVYNVKHDLKKISQKLLFYLYLEEKSKLQMFKKS
jgi:hypothetical protein